jgi:hypothetical protein
MKTEFISLSWLKWLLLGLLLFPLAYLSFKKFSDYSWVIILLATFSYLLLLGLKIKIVTFKILFFNISAIFFALFLYEGFLWLRNMSPTNGKSIQTTGEYSVANQYLGYGPKNEGVFISKETINNEVIFDVSYTIKDGLRYTPNSNEKSHKCVLFFGCSFTFGEGLSDTSTLPFFFNQYANQQYNVLNYGFSGYGPHQMLANIENRVAKDIQVYKNQKIAIYSFIIDHVSRAAGYASWDQKGPKYETIDGSIRRVGAFSKLPRIIVNHLSHSYIYKRLFCERKPTHLDWMRTVEIIKKSNELLLKDNVHLYVFVWDNPRSIVKSIQSDYNYFIDEMKRNEIKIFFLNDAIWDYDEKINTYSIHKDDLHPNAMANKKIAEYLYLQLKD